MSLTFAAVVNTLSGVPFPSQIRWCLLPVLRRSTGDGPVAAPPFLRGRASHPHTLVTGRARRPRSVSRAEWGATCSKTLACCQRSRRRQQVCPEPNPSSGGRSCQAMFWCRTCRMPCRHKRSGTGLGPGDRSGQGGSNGSISAHKSSSTIHGRVVTPTERSDRRNGHSRAGHFNKILLRALRVRMTFCRHGSLRCRVEDRGPIGIPGPGGYLAEV